MDETARVAAQVARRLGVCGMVRGVARWLCVGTGVALAVVLAERLVSLGVGTAMAIVVPMGVGLVVGLALGLLRWPSRATAALRADAQLNLHERLSSALAAGDGPMAALVRADAARCAAAIDVNASFPVSPPLSARALPLLVALLVVAALVPDLDLWGRGRARAARTARSAAVRNAVAETQAELASLRDKARDQGLDGTAVTVEGAARALGKASTPQEGVGEAERVKDGLDARRQANERTLDAATTDAERQRLLRTRDVLANASRAIERLRERLGGSGSGAGVASGRGGGALGAGDEPKAQFAQPQATPQAPADVEALSARLVAAQAGATEAMVQDRIPWRYRDVVKRYFSPNDSPSRPMR